MKVLSIKEPYATLIKMKHKKIETRSWKTKYRGELYIHASISKAPKKLLEKDFMKSFVTEQDLSYGKIILKANLVDCIEMTKEWIEKLKKENPQEYLLGLYEEGRYAWILENVTPLEQPIIAKGKLGIWNYQEKEYNDGKSSK